MGRDILSLQTSTVSGMSEKERGGWGWCLLPVLIMFVGTGIVWSIFMLQLNDPSLAGRQSFSVGPLTWSILQIVLFLIASAQLRRRGVMVKNLVGFSRQRLWQDIGLAVVLASALNAVIAASQMLTAMLMIKLVRMSEVGPPPFPRWAIAWWTIVGSITAGVGEEIYFRGFLMERLKRLSPPWLVMVTGLAFAVWHLSPFLFLHTFVIGVLFGILYLRMKRLFPLMLTHILINFIGGIGMWFFMAS